jgi:hypothetical protein
MGGWVDEWMGGYSGKLKNWVDGIVQTSDIPSAKSP